MAAGALLRGVTGFKLVFQSKCLRMDIAACAAHVLIQFQARKRKILHEPSRCFYEICHFDENQLLKPELLPAAAVATADLASILSINKFQ